MGAVIHPRSYRVRKRAINRDLYRARYHVEVFFLHLERFRALATRDDKAATCYLGLVHVACAWRWRH